MVENKFEKVNRAFSKQSSYFDEYDQSNRILCDMREQVRQHVLRYLKKEDYILELNAGTGLDAHFFTQQGNKVFATDVSDGMIEKMHEKLERFHLQEKLKIQQCSFEQLEHVKETGFDYVFSNFGGLNCTDDLKKVNKEFPRLLNPGAYVTLVLMPFISPWELVYLFKGNFKYAFRRFRKKGVKAHLEGEHFMVYYMTPGMVKKKFGKDYKVVHVEGMGSIMPSPDLENFPSKYPRLYSFLKRTDKVFRGYFPFNSFADHFIITLQYSPR